MMRSEFPWLIVIVAIIGVVLAMVAFIRTPKEEKFKLKPKQKTILEELESTPKNQMEKLIKGDKKKAFLYFLPLMTYFAFIAAMMAYISNVGVDECARILNINTAILSLILFCYGLTTGIFLFSLMYLKTGINTVKTGYFPPLDSVQFRDTIATKGVVSKIRGYVCIALPILSLYFIYYGHYTFTQFTKGGGIHELQESIEEKCK